MNTGNKLKKSSVKKVKKLSPNTEKAVLSKAPKPVTLTKNALPVLTTGSKVPTTGSKVTTTGSIVTTTGSKVPTTGSKVPKPRSMLAPLNAEQLKAASKQPLPKADVPKSNAPKSKIKAVVPLLVPNPKQQKTAPPKPVNVIKKHTRKTNLKNVLNTLERNMNSANNFEDAYKIEGVDMSREEYKKRRS